MDPSIFYQVAPVQVHFLILLLINDPFFALAQKGQNNPITQVTLSSLTPTKISKLMVY